MRRERGLGRRRRRLGRDVLRYLDLADGLPHLDDLGRARPGVTLEPAALGPLVGSIVVVGVAEQEARSHLVNDEPQVAGDARRPEVLVLAVVDAVHLDAGVRRVQLQVEGRCLRGLLLVRRQLREAVGEGVRDPELHQSTRNTFITSSPRWLMTFTAMRPDSGLSNGREMALFSVSQASWLISALSVVFSDL